MSPKLTAGELATRRAPSMDLRGARFDYEGRILRAYRGEHADFYSALLKAPFIEELFDLGLARTWISSIQVDGFDLVIESERVPVVSYPPEWPTAMLREAGLLIARLARALAAHGLGLHDSHPWNVLFHGTRAVWVDVSSIVSSADVSTLWEREFRTHIVVPLALHAHRLHALADAVAAEHRVLRAKRALDARALRAFYPPRYARLRRNWRKPITYFESLVRYLEDLPAVPTQSDWSDYQQSPDARVGHPETYNQKQLAVDTYLRSFDGARVLDVGANAGWFSELAVALGHEATAIEPDDFTASSLFTKAHDRGLPILPLKLDVMWPLGSHGLGLAHPAAPDRLRCDASLWLAILHHLSRNGYTFETISRIVDMFTRTSALIEFVPRDDIHLRGWALANEPWYTMENFVSAMAPYFPEVTVLPSTPAPRVMLHFRRHASQ